MILLVFAFSLVATGEGCLCICATSSTAIFALGIVLLYAGVVGCLLVWWYCMTKRRWPR